MPVKAFLGNNDADLHSEQIHYEIAATMYLPIGKSEMRNVYYNMQMSNIRDLLARK